MRKATGIGIAVVLVLLMTLAGCTQKTATQPTEQGTPAPSEPTSPAPSEPASAPTEAAPQTGAPTPAEGTAPSTPAEGATTETAPATSSGPGNVKVVRELLSKKTEATKWDKQQGTSVFSNVRCTQTQDGRADIEFTVRNDDGDILLTAEDSTKTEAGAQVTVNGERLKTEKLAAACGLSEGMIKGGSSFTCKVNAELHKSPLDGSQKTNLLMFTALSITSELDFLCA